MGYVVDDSQALLLSPDHSVIGFYTQSGFTQLLTTDQVRQQLGYAHNRHIYWLVERGYLPFRKFGRELVFTQQDVELFRMTRGH